MPTVPRAALTRLAPVLALSFVLAACGSTTGTSDEKAMADAPSATMADDMKKSDDMKKDIMSSATADTADTGAAMVKGAYLTQAEYQDMMTERQGSTVVYFFDASWCPTCQDTNKSLIKDGVPDGLTVVKIDYDAATDLKKQYGVTTQHTFVVVDSMGHEVKKFTSATSGADIKAKAA
ncbi:MAG: thioredoxin family protein [Nostocoides sp.]